MTTHTAVAAALAQTSIHPGHPVRVRVNGTSMRPLVNVGDYVRVEQVPIETLHPGDVVTVWQNNSLLTHRLLRMDQHGCVTKGDNCAALDPPLAAELIMGRVVALERRGKRIDLRCRRWRVVGRAVAWLSRAALFQQGWLRTARMLARAAAHLLVVFVIHWEKHDVHA